MTTVAERRALLKTAADSHGAEALAALRTALAGASEADRKTLARSRPPSRWFLAEGPTPRACLALGGLGSAKLIVDTISTGEGFGPTYDARAGVLTDQLMAAVADRDDAFLLDLVERVADCWWRSYALKQALVVGIVATGRVLPRSVEYLRFMVQELTRVDSTDDCYQPETDVAGRIATWPRCHDESLWHLFETEGIGENHFLTDQEGGQWDTAIATLAADPETRARLLDASLGALLRDFPARSVRWYLQVHRLLDPTAAEIGERAATCLAVLQTQPGTAVGLAQELFTRAELTTLDATALVDASAAVLRRTEKKLRKTQLGLLAALVKTHPDLAARVSDAVAEVVAELPSDLVPAARRLVLTEAADGANAEGADDRSGTPVVVPPPRGTDLPVSWPAPTALDRDELADLLAEQLEGVGDGADLPRLVEALDTTAPGELPDALLDRARAVLAVVVDPWTPDIASPRRHVAAILLARSGESPPIVDFAGFEQRVMLRAGEPVPDDVVVEEHTLDSYQLGDTGEEELVDTWTVRSGRRFIPTHAPEALFAQAMTQGRLGGCSGHTETARRTPPERQVVAWRRVLLRPGPGPWGHDPVVGGGRRPGWLPAEPVPVPEHPDFAQAVLDVADVGAEFTYRVHAARWQDGFDQIVQWTAWVLRDNPDTLAAHAHPMLCAATEVANVRGIGPLFAALGRSPYVLAGPGLSALALGLSAKTPEHRTLAAEAVAELAERGLLRPDLFAEQIATHLADGYVIAGRVTQALSDAATVSALAGHRVLLTLAALLADGVAVSKLVELTARLAADYGTPIAVPDALTPRAKGSTVLAAALRALRDQQPRRTELAVLAAEQAER
ncbi:hypothetical protein KVF89_23135 [Nocardioides carbamazepini]|uniref:DUF6493 family protein n=1 Tax=Nocardioides carbamazepini TaxID=2854259 RepID=UPI002149DA7A|nr:DUF6493 family protein [Nocardioides carbamazepini]MCR1785451.1 hypothetical protein [Nocardioides carbamazepini]